MGTLPTTFRSSAALLAILATTATCKSKVNLDISADPSANDTMAIEVDVLVVYDDEVAQILRELGAPAWFETRAQLLAKYPGKLFHRHWELAPGRAARVEWESDGKEQRDPAVLVFADYVTGEPKFADVTGVDNARIFLCDKALALTPCS